MYVCMYVCMYACMHAIMRSLTLMDIGLSVLFFFSTFYYCLPINFHTKCMYVCMYV